MSYIKTKKELREQKFNFHDSMAYIIGHHGFFMECWGPGPRYSDIILLPSNKDFEELENYDSRYGDEFYGPGLLRNCMGSLIGRFKHGEEFERYNGKKYIALHINSPFTPLNKKNEPVVDFMICME